MVGRLNFLDKDKGDINWWGPFFRSDSQYDKHLLIWWIVKVKVESKCLKLWTTTDRRVSKMEKEVCRLVA